jgi:hypothetical protein
MLARVTVIEGDPGWSRRSGSSSPARPPQVTWAARLAGQLLAGDRTSGRVLILGVYDSQESLRATAETVAGWREQDVPVLGGRVVAVDEYEVIA